MKNKHIKKGRNLLIFLSFACLLLSVDNVFSANNNSRQQPKNFLLKGKVTDDTGEPLPGASVFIKETTNGVITDFDGFYEIEVTAGDIIVFSYIGMQAKEVLYASQQTLNVELQPDAIGLQEVVVVGYGSQKREKVVGAVGQLDSDEMEKVATVSLENQLAGKMSGVIINQSNGQPGADSQIVIRGLGTLTAGSNPLIVVDGFPLTEGSSLSSINPNDIDKVDVLKDAASAAIYGSRAANGVILVTTKKGKRNDTVNIGLDFYTSIQQLSTNVEYIDAYEQAQFLKEARNWGYVSKDPNNRSEDDSNAVRLTKSLNGKPIDGRELYLDFLQPYIDGVPGLTNTNWMDEAFRTAKMNNYTVSASGGNKKTNFYTSIGYLNQEGIIINTGLERYSATFSLNSKFNDKTTFGFNIKPSFTDKNFQDQADRSSGALTLLALNFPYYSPYLENGELNISDQIVNEQRKILGKKINGTPVENLVATSRLVKRNRKEFRVFGNLFAETEILKDLKYKISLGGDYKNYIYNFYHPRSVGSYRKPVPRKDANSRQNKDSRINYLIENTLNYTKKLDLHNFNLLLGHTFQKEIRNFSNVDATGFPDDNIQNIAGGSSFSVDAFKAVWTLESYFGRLQYDFDSKYLVSLALRRDGSSRFGAKNRWGNFPSASLGWIISKEDFFPTSDLVNFVKISGSWGQTGNNQIGTYSSQSLVSSSDYISNGGIVAGYISKSSANDRLGWEIANSINFSLDLGLLNNKINLSTAIYKTNTRDLLLNVPVPQQTGYSKVLANIGEMENKGWEFQLTGNRFMLGEVSVGFNANITTFSNKVLALGPGQNKIATGREEAFVTKIGGSIAEIYTYNIQGVYKTQDEIDNSPHLGGTLIGDYIVEDVNGDGKIDVNDKTSKGDYAPDLTYGFGMNFSYKNLDFSFNFTGVEGRTMVDNDMVSLTEAGEGFGIQSKYYYENRYHPVNNPDGFLARPNFGNFSNARKQTRFSSVVEKDNGDYIRLRDVRLAYNFNEELVERIKMSSLQLYISGNNLFTITKYRGWNPDGGIIKLFLF